MKLRIKLTIIPEVRELLEQDSVENPKESQMLNGIIRQLNEYEKDTSGRIKPYLELSVHEADVLRNAVNSITLYPY